LILDVCMLSPPPGDMLYGASCTTGGVLCGWAHGNVFNHADNEDQPLIGSHKGKVYIYQSPKDPMTHKPDMSITSEVTPTLKPVLKTLNWRYSPVSSE
jgi:hypothetical protein